MYSNKSIGIIVSAMPTVKPFNKSQQLTIFYEYVKKSRVLSGP